MLYAYIFHIDLVDFFPQDQFFFFSNSCNVVQVGSYFKVCSPLIER